MGCCCNRQVKCLMSSMTSEKSISFFTLRTYLDRSDKCLPFLLVTTVNFFIKLWSSIKIAYFRNMLRYSVLAVHDCNRKIGNRVAWRCLSEPATPKVSHHDEKKPDNFSGAKVSAMIGHNFPDFIEWWSRKNFKRVGNGLIAATALCAVGGATTAMTATSMIPTVVVGSVTACYWYVGLQDIQQTSHAIRRNYPLLGNLRYIMETVRA
jgi:hypothetical protein